MSRSTPAQPRGNEGEALIPPVLGPPSGVSVAHLRPTLAPTTQVVHASIVRVPAPEHLSLLRAVISYMLKVPAEPTIQ